MTAHDHLLRFQVQVRCIAHHVLERCADERGEGVISAAIAVLIMAFLGAAMWIGFNGIWENLLSKTNDSVNQIGPAVGG
jgi:hypothetical protein